MMRLVLHLGAYMKKTIDTKYILRLKQGDTSVFEVVFNHYKDQLFLFAMTLVKNVPDAEEVVQETFINVIKMIHSLNDESRFHSWIFRICYNQSMLLHRKNRKYSSPKEEYNIEEQIESDEKPKDLFEKNEVIRVISGEISDLPDTLSQTAQLYYLNSLTISEISNILDVPKGTIKNRLFRSRKLIKQRLDEKGYAPDKIFGVAFTPLMFEAYQSIMAETSTSMTLSANSIVSQNTIAATGSGIGMKIALVVGLASGGGLLAKGIIDAQETIQIEEIAYYNEPIGETVEVVVKTNQSIDQTTTSVSNIENDNLVIKDNELIFYVEKNGTYTVQIDDVKRDININNIDKAYPVLSSVQLNDDNTLSIVVEDEGSGIDYSDSSVLYNNQEYSLKDTIQIEKDYIGEIKIILVDKAGNITQDTVMVNSVKQ